MAFCSSSPFHPFLSGPSFHVTTGGRAKTVRCGGPLASTRGGRDSVFLDWCLRFRNNRQSQSISWFTTGEEARKVCYTAECCSRSHHIWRSYIACISSVNIDIHTNTRGVQMRLGKSLKCAIRLLNKQFPCPLLMCTPWSLFGCCGAEWTVRGAWEYRCTL